MTAPPTTRPVPAQRQHETRHRPGRPSAAEYLSCPCCHREVSEPAFVTHLLTNCPGTWSTW